MRTPALKLLLGAYFHQDWFEEFADEDAAVDAFVDGEPHLRDQLRRELEAILSTMDEGELEAHLGSLGCEYVPAPNVGYRGWVEQIGMRLERTAAT